MEINEEIKEVLAAHKINRSQGTLCLLAFYYNLDADTVIHEEVLKAINLTKIVEKDYATKTLKWNIPLFKGVETEFGWVAEWNNKFGRINPNRKDSIVDVTKRMKDFFAKFPSYRTQDVIKATDTYLTTVKDSEYLKSSAKFIFEGIGAMKKSLLLTWCEKTASSSQVTQQKGTVIK